MNPPDLLIAAVSPGPGAVVTYGIDGAQVRHRHLAVALATVARPRAAVLFATPQARAEHGAEVTATIEAIGGTVAWRALPAEASARAAWSLFETLQGVILEAAGGEVWVEVGYPGAGWPAVVVSALAAGEPPAGPRIRALSASWAGDSGVVAVAELGPMWDLPSWSVAAREVAQAGRCTALEAHVGQLQAWYGRAGKDEARAALGRLGAALQAFGLDFATLRVGALLGPSGSARRLTRSLAEGGGWIGEVLPPVSSWLAVLGERLTPLTDTERGRGVPALAHLARYYLDAGRPPDALTIACEAHVTRYAREDAQLPPGARAVGSTGFVLGSFASLRRAAESKASADAGFRTREALRATVRQAGFDGEGRTAAEITEQTRAQILALLAEAEA